MTDPTPTAEDSKVLRDRMPEGAGDILNVYFSPEEDCHIICAESGPWLWYADRGLLVEYPETEH